MSNQLTRSAPRRSSHAGLPIWVLLGPIIVGSAAGQLALFFDRFFASTLAPGYIAGMNYATKLVNFPQQIFAAAIATPRLPMARPLRRISPASPSTCNAAA